MKWFKSWLAPQSKTPVPKTRLQAETLEAREVMSASLSGNTLTITSGTARDVVDVNRVYFEDRYYLQVNERIAGSASTATSWFDEGRVSRINWYGRGGNDSFTNRTGVRTFAYGEGGNDTLIGGWGVDFLNGGSGDDILQGGAGTDVLRGGFEKDKLFGGSGTDSLYGEGGNDFLDGGGGGDYLSGGGGLDFNARVTALNGATMEDVKQDQSPTCSCLASIGALAHSGRDLTTLITYIGVGNTGTTPKYQVRLHDGDRWRYHTVNFDGSLIQDFTGIYDAVPVTDGANSTGCEQQSWVTILQRAYLQSQGVNWRSPAEVRDDGSCDPEDAMTAFSGVRTIQYDAGWLDYVLDSEDRTRIINALNAGKAVVAGTFNESDDLNTEKLVAQHAYTVVDWRMREDGMIMFTLRNPWARDGGTDLNGNGVIDGADGSPNDALVEVDWLEFRHCIQDYWIG